MKKIIVLLLLSIVVVLAACTKSDETPNKADTHISINVDSTSKNGIDVKEDDSLTEEEMMKIGKELRESKVKEFYNIKNDEQLKSFLDKFYLEDNQVRFDTFKKSYKENLELYTSGIIILSDESVELYDEKGFVYKAKGKETATKKDNTIETATYKITMTIHKDTDGKYKINTETID
ncbi:hypothetical protein ACF3MZ_11130 [Paenibacillaceae bacterium WGS1546]|uniref:hypothetical protein n=1 Tax=Cohnella sp. WGS1546 TaxID=3366810 RepID=UPI00372D0319